MILTHLFPHRPDSVKLTVVRTLSSIGAATPTLDLAQRTARRCSYGITIVFSLMLILLVVVGAMLWLR